MVIIFKALNQGWVLALSHDGNDNGTTENKPTFRWKILATELFYLIPMGLGLFTCKVFSWYLFEYGIYTWPGRYVCP